MHFAPPKTQRRPGQKRDGKRESQRRSQRHSQRHSQLERDHMRNVHVEDAINAMLVEDGVRNAMLIQPQDYGNHDHTEMPTQQIISSLQALCPTLHMSTNYETYQGVLFSKKNYNGKKDIDLNAMGQLLDYPCYEGFDDLDRNQEHYELTIYLYFADGEKKDWISNVCPNLEKKPVMEAMAKKALAALQSPKRRHMLQYVKKEVINVQVEVRRNVPTVMVLRKLMDSSNGFFDNDELRTMEMAFYALDFETETAQRITYELFEPDNDVHRGMMIHLLIQEIHPLMSPFFPLQKHPVEKQEIDGIRKEMEQTMQFAFYYTKHQK